MRNRDFQSIGYPVDGGGQKVAYTGTAGTSSAVGTQTYKVYVFTSPDAYICFGATATTSDFPMAAGVPQVFNIKPGQTVSAIQDSTGGNLFVGELDA